VRTIDVAQTAASIEDLIQIASEEPLVLRASDGKEFLLAEFDDLAHEAALIRQNPELMALLKERSKETKRHTLAEVRRNLGLD
jgi:hypothetical protein